jgi:glycosyltransferase involved in cell wall biosynthesis
MSLIKILFLTTQLPYPPNSGGTVKSWNYVNHLSKKNELHVGCLLKNDDSKHEKSFQENIQLKSYFSTALEIGRSPLNLLKSYFQSPCLNAFRNYSKKFAEQVIKSAQLVDIIVVDHYEVFQYVPQHFSGKVVMHTHNAEFMLWQRMSELSINPIKKIILKIEANRVKKYEKEIFESSDLIFSTPSDIELYYKQGFNTTKHHVTFHLGNDKLLDLQDLNFNETENAISFMGTLCWEPNIDGLVWFIKEVWPLVKEINPEVIFYIMGKSPDDRIIKAINHDSNIILTGFVKELDTYLKKTRAYIAPLRFGSGMKVKVLEGLYRGVPTVATTVAAEGLEVKNKCDIFINDEPIAFAKSCLELLNNESKWNQFRDNSRKIAQERYTWKDLFHRMDESMKTLSQRNSNCCQGS